MTFRRFILLNEYQTAKTGQEFLAGEANIAHFYEKNTPTGWFKGPLVALARVGAQKFGLVWLSIPFGGVRRWHALAGYIGPFKRVLGINFQPFFDTVFRIGQNRFGRAFGFANTAVNTFIRMDDQEVFTFVEAIDRANFNTIHMFALDAIFDDNVSHGNLR